MTLLGKFCVSAEFSVSLLYISELYPTTIRNTGLGTSFTVSQIGSIIAPYLVELLVKITKQYICYDVKLYCIND